ncbi:LysR substrate-binding domain-containing protein [Micromonospora sp. KC721]|uniref:LysR substrate-binding domain-containing protein n=1 Tax=Micromonospora sp. KC721 TaxID=2530380 RepID=UPI001FB82A08|nr:LysR substrate-binding domain-containing protein [Micromonospora sp. KC721]
MAGIDEATATARGQTGTLTVSTFHIHHQEITAVLDMFRQRHPKCELRMRETLVADPFGGLRAGRIDVAVTRTRTLSAAALLTKVYGGTMSDSQRSSQDGPPSLPPTSHS